MEELKSRNWKIIVGAHVGETSILTRAAMTIAQYAGDMLIGQEGGYGDILLEQDYVKPSLHFGVGGMLDLSVPYNIMEGGKNMVYPVTNWKNGWGLSLSG